MRSRVDQSIDVVLGEVRSQQIYGGKMKPALGQRPKEHREPSSGASGTDPLERSIIREAQLLHAERVHGRVAGRSEEPPRVHLRDVREKHRRVDAIPRDERGQLPKKVRVTEMSQMVVHESTCRGAGFAREAWPGGGQDHNKPVCSERCGSGMSSNVRINFALVAACPAWQLLKNTNVFCVFWFSSRILSAHSLSSDSEYR